MSIRSLMRKFLPHGRLRYQHSSHKDQYEAIARKFHTTPSRVYEIAHGRRVAYDEHVILEALREEGIIGTRK